MRDKDASIESFDDEAAPRPSSELDPERERIVSLVVEKIRLHEQTMMAMFGGNQGAHHAGGPPVGGSADPPSEPSMTTAVELMALDLPEPRWALPGLLPEGLSLLGGRLHQDATAFCLELARAVAAGDQALGKITAPSGDVLYLALDDTPFQLKCRLQRLLQGRPPSARLAIAHTWPREHDHALAALETWLQQHPQARLVVIDSLDSLFPRLPAAAHRPADITPWLQAIQAMANRYHVALVVVCPLRRAPAHDPFEALGGGVTLTAAADALLFLRRPLAASRATLRISGPDLEEHALALDWEASAGAWTLLGRAEEVQSSHERQKILRLLSEADQPLTPTQVAGLIGCSRETVKVTLWRMGQRGELAASGGRYHLAASPEDPAPAPLEAHAPAPADVTPPVSPLLPVTVTAPPTRPVDVPARVPEPEPIAITPHAPAPNPPGRPPRRPPTRALRRR